MYKIILITCLSLGILSAINSQTEGLEKKGLLFGVAVGASQATLSIGEGAREKSSGISLPNIKVGKSISEKVAVLLYLPGSLYEYNNNGRTRDRGFEAILPSVQFWPSERMWLLTGIGLGMDAPVFFDIKSEEERNFNFGYAFTLGAGYELIHFNNKTIDLQARFHYGSIETELGKLQGRAFSILLGFNIF